VQKEAKNDAGNSRHINPNPWSMCMTKLTAAERLAQLAEQPKGGAALIRQLLPKIDAALARGHSLTAVLDTLKEDSLSPSTTLDSFKSMLHRARKERKAMGAENQPPETRFEEFDGQIARGDANYKAMFEDAVRSLGAIDAALGIHPDEAGGAAPILEAIEAIKSRTVDTGTSADLERLSNGLESCIRNARLRKDAYDVGYMESMLKTLEGVITRTADAAASSLITFDVSIATYGESHQTSYLVRVSRSDRATKDLMDETGVMTVFQHTNREHAETEANAWKAFLCAAHPTRHIDFVTGAIGAPLKHHAALTAGHVDTIMEQAQVFASAWSLVNGPFDQGNALERAEQEKTILRNLLCATELSKPTAETADEVRVL
jgi:hypothetical protein